MRPRFKGRRINPIPPVWVSQLASRITLRRRQRPGRRCLQTIAYARLGNENVRMSRFTLDLGSYSANKNAQILSVLLIVSLPNFSQQALVCNDIAGVCSQHLQQLIFLSTQSYEDLAAGNLAGGEVDRERPSLDHRAFSCILEISPQSCLAACQELGHSEWLDDVIIGTPLEKVNLFVLIGSNGKHNDRHVRPLSNLDKNIRAILVR